MSWERGKGRGDGREEREGELGKRKGGGDVFLSSLLTVVVVFFLG